MKQIIALSATVLVLLAIPGFADPTFYATPNTYPGTSSILDVPWQTDVGSFIERDLDSFSQATDIDTLTFGSVLVDVGLGGLGGTASTAEIFISSGWGSSSEYGTVYKSALLNRDAGGAKHGDIVFDFSSPVAGFGAWLYDNNAASRESFQMVVTEVGGTEYTSGLLESGNGTEHFVEGWLGATSAVGITSVSYRVLDASGAPVGDKYFEMDHLQLSPVPVPGAILLGVLGLGAAGIRLRRRV